jgi:hypothetical protein
MTVHPAAAEARQSCVLLDEGLARKIAAANAVAQESRNRARRPDDWSITGPKPPALAGQLQDSRIQQQGILDQVTAPASKLPTNAKWIAEHRMAAFVWSWAPAIERCLPTTRTGAAVPGGSPRGPANTPTS